MFRTLLARQRTLLGVGEMRRRFREGVALTVVGTQRGVATKMETKQTLGKFDDIVNLVHSMMDKKGVGNYKRDKTLPMVQEVARLEHYLSKNELFNFRRHVLGLSSLGQMETHELSNLFEHHKSEPKDQFFKNAENQASIDPLVPLDHQTAQESTDTSLKSSKGPNSALNQSQKRFNDIHALLNSPLDKSHAYKTRKLLLIKSLNSISFFKDQMLPAIWLAFRDGPQTTQLELLFDPTYYYEIIVPLLLYSKDFESALLIHNKLYTIIKLNELKVNWLPVILGAVLSKTSRGMEALTQIHSRLDLAHDGFFNHIIPVLASQCRQTSDLNNLLNWTLALTNLGDIPSSSDPLFTDVVLKLLRGNYHKQVLEIFHALGNDKVADLVSNGKWASPNFMDLITQCINFNQTRDQTVFIAQFLAKFDRYQYIHEIEFWSKLIQLAEHREESLIDDVELFMANYDLKSNYNIHSLKCIKSSTDEQFLNNFDTLINYHNSLPEDEEGRNIPPSVLAGFIRILVKCSFKDSASIENLTAIQRVEEALKMVQEYIAHSKVGEDKTGEFFIMCYELSRGFLMGLIRNDQLSKYEKLDFVARLESFIYETLEKLNDPFEKPSQRRLFNLETQIIKFRLSLGQIEQALSRQEMLVENVERLNLQQNLQYQINPTVASHLAGIVTSEILDNLKLAYEENFNQELVSNYNNKLIVLSLKIFTKMYRTDPKSVGIDTWTRLLINTARVRPFKEFEYLSWWLVRTIGVQKSDEIKVKTSHSSHPLSQLFSHSVIKRLIKLSFTNIPANGAYEPWKTLELLLKISDLTGIHLDTPQIYKEIKWGLTHLYVKEDHQLSPVWRQAKTANLLNSSEAIKKYNETWKSTYIGSETPQHNI